MNIVLKRIKEFNKDRLPDMVELKYEGMRQNLFRFYRGANHLFYEDLHKTNEIPHSPAAWICGDLHLENFGSYKGSNRLVYFDLNDFDESILAPASWELLRMVTSIFVAFESLKIEQKKALNMATLFLKTYSSVLAEGKPDYIEPRTAKGIVCEFLTEVSKRKQKEILKKRTVQKKNRLEILMDDPRHFELDKKLKKDLSLHINWWLKNDGNSPYNYKVIDAVFRLAGTGSVGLKRYAFLLRSLNETGDKYMMIDMKQSTASALKTYLDQEQPAWLTQAERIVSVQKRMQNREPALLSTTIYNGEAYVIQEMQPTKDSINFKLIKKEYRNIYQVIHDMAMLTASSQLRSSGRQGSAITDELIAFGKDDSWRDAILDYSLKYSRQVKTYYREFKNEHKK
jgi:uncharacterized protein (DUF2252 family)